MTNADSWARVIQARTQHADLLLKRMWTLHHGGRVSTEWQIADPLVPEPEVAEEYDRTSRAGMPKSVVRSQHQC